MFSGCYPVPYRLLPAATGDHADWEALARIDQPCTIISNHSSGRAPRLAAAVLIAIPPAEREPLAEQRLKLGHGGGARRAQRAVMAAPAHGRPPVIDDIASATTPSMDSAIAALTTR